MTASIRRTRRCIPLIGVALIAGGMAGCDGPAAPEPALIAHALSASTEERGYAHADRLRDFCFPDDHGPHPAFRAEWWYYTGNVRTADGRRFGYQLTFFRYGLSPQEASFGTSAWRSNQIYLAHFALTDVDVRRFHAFERSSRAALDVAGAGAQPFRVWVDDWSARSDSGSFAPRLQARAEDVAIDLQLAQGKPVVLQGDRGLSRKGARPDNASYYYSLTRMPTAGTITVNGRAFKVEGASWMDREWSTSSLDPDQPGWDWFALQFEDGRELMYYRLRRRDGRTDPHSAGVLVTMGEVIALGYEMVLIEELTTWRSPKSGVTYPARWRFQVPTAGLDLEVDPLLADQEIGLSMRYWEGAAQFTGTDHGKPVSGRGYVELVGYATSR